METTILESALSQGIWAVLTVVLLFYIIRTQERRDEKQDEREKKYQELLNSLSEKFAVIYNIKDDIEDIKSNLLTVQSNKNN